MRGRHEKHEQGRGLRMELSGICVCGWIKLWQAECSIAFMIFCFVLLCNSSYSMNSIYIIVHA